MRACGGLSGNLYRLAINRADKELNAAEYKILKRPVEQLGVDEKQKDKLLSDKWRQIRKAKARLEERKLATESSAEEPRSAAEADHQSKSVN